MAFQFERNESPDDAVRRIAREQIDGALQTLEDDDVPPGKTVHELRKYCKKLRGLVRIVRPALGSSYRLENAWFRDTARLLAPLRDTEVVLATLDELIDSVPEDAEPNAPLSETTELAHGLQRRALLDLRGRLAPSGSAAQATDAEMRTNAETRDTGPRPAATATPDATATPAADPDPDPIPAQVRERLREARRRIPDWPRMPRDFSAFAEALAQTYRRGRNAYRWVAREDGDEPESNHEWRKRAKYHWYHMQLLRDVWPAVLTARAHEAHRLSQLLGSEHDLVVLQSAVVLQSPAEALGAADVLGSAAPDTVNILKQLISARRRELMARAIPLGARLYAEKPKDLVARLGTYWEIRHAPER